MPEGRRGCNLIIKYNGNLKPLSKELKKSQTRHENRLWFDYLKSYPIRFRRQFIIGNYIADFYCRRAKLVVELDGSQHFYEDGVIKDNIRSEYFLGEGIEILRFSNYEIDNEFEAVCFKIDDTIKRLMGG